MNIGGILINKEIPTALLDGAKQTAKRLGGGSEKLRFIVVCDLDADSHYGTNLLCVTDKRSFVLDDAGEVLHTVAHADTEEVKVRRLYGNARLVVRRKGGDTTELTRSTYAVASLCDMAADYITAIAGGEDEARAFETVEATYDKLMRFCPKCGRRLLHPGAECINCQSKGKTFTKLAKYLKPEIPNLIVCLILSLITTALTMVPPTMISTLVDDILPGRDLDGLYRIVALLMATHISFCIISMFRSYRLRLSGDKVVYALRNDVFAKAQHLSMRFYDKTSTGSVINRISGDTNTIQAFMLRVTQEVVTQFFSMIGIAVIMFAMNYKLALLTLALAPAREGAKLLINDLFSLSESANAYVYARLPVAAGASRLLACALLSGALAFLSAAVALSQSRLPALLALSGMSNGIEWLGFYPLFHAAALCQTQGTNAAGAPYNLLWVPIFLVVVAAALAWAIGNDLTEAYEWAGVDLDAL